MTENSLVKRATLGQLSEKELRDIADGLASSKDPYEGLLVLGRAEAKQYRGLVEGYLDASDNPMLARLALQILCRYWDLTEQYLCQIMTFMEGVDWDEEDDVRLMAIGCAGSFLLNHSCKPLLAALLRIFHDTNERQLIREVAYRALAESTGVPILRLPPASRHFDLDAVDQAVIDAVKQALAKD